MPITVVVGGQYGSEGKGKVAHWLAREERATVAVRVGGTNSGHTVIDPVGNALIFRMLPTAAILPGVICVLPAGSYICVDLLIEEIKRAGIAKERLIIDPNAVILTEREVRAEATGSLVSSIGSTGSGTGAAVISRILRDGNVRFAAQEACLKEFVRPVVPFMRARLDAGERIVIEGTQGFGLSVLHSPHYPYVTSRDTTAAAFVSEVGLSPRDVDDVVMVLRAYPIRVGGNSGPLAEEIDWTTVSRESGYSSPLLEHTSVTKRVRRVARFDTEIVKQAILHDNPTRLVLNHLDYVDASCRDSIMVTTKAMTFVKHIQSQLARKINYFGMGPGCVVCHR